MASPQEILDQKTYLKDKGTSLSEFKEVKKKDKNFFILGSGNFGYAEKMIGKDNKPYAIKKLDKHSKKFNLKNFHRETRISIQLEHENLIRFYGYFEDKENIAKFKEIKEDQIAKSNNRFKENLNFRNETEDKEIYCLVMEFAENGSLEDYIDNYRKGYLGKEEYVPISQEIVIKFLEQSLSALKYLHEKKIVHRDIKPDNILLDKDNNIKISDLGIAARFQEKDEQKNNIDKELISEGTKVGRRDFVCPEILDNKSYDYRCDIYSLGVTMLCILSEEDPIKFVKVPNSKQKERCIKTDCLNNTKFYNEYLLKLIGRMLTIDTNTRPTSRQCYDELMKIKTIIKNPDDEEAKIYLQNKNNPKKREKFSYKICYLNKDNKENKDNVNKSYKHNNTSNFSSSLCLGQNMMNENGYGYGNSISTENSYQNPGNYLQTPIQYFQNPNQSLYPNQYFQNPNQSLYPNQYLQNPNQSLYPNQYLQNPNSYLPTSNPNYSSCDYGSPNQNIQSFSNNSSIVSVLQCLSCCFEDFEINNFKFFCKETSSFSYDIMNMIENVKTGANNGNFLQCIQNFRNKGSNLIEYFKGTEEIEPILVYYGLCNNINNESRINNSICPNLIYRDFKEMEEVPKNKFPNVYDLIKDFKENFHSEFVNKFYYILLNLTKCPNCNHVLNAEIKDEYGVCSFIPLVGIFIDTISNLLDNYMSTQFNSSSSFECSNCNYKGPGKNEVGFLNTPKYLIINFDGDKDLKILDETIDLTKYSLTKDGKNKYKLLSFITKQEESNKFGAYIKTEQGNWRLHNENNVGEENIIFVKSNYIPHLAIYERE